MKLSSDRPIEVTILRIRTKMESSQHVGAPGVSSFYGDHGEHQGKATRVDKWARQDVLTNQVTFTCGTGTQLGH